jgi:hypothetical protein
VDHITTNSLITGAMVIVAAAQMVALFRLVAQRGRPARGPTAAARLRVARAPMPRRTTRPARAPGAAAGHAPPQNAAVSAPRGLRLTNRIAAGAYERLFVGDETHPDINITRWTDLRELEGFMEVPEEELDRRFLNKILEQAPKLLALGAAREPHLFRLTFAEHVTEGLQNGTYRLADRLRGGLSAQASMLTAQAPAEARVVPLHLQPSLVATSGFQILSVLVAQKHLADIGAKLSRIASGLSDVRSFLDEQRLARLKANIKHLRSIAASIDAGKATIEDLGLLRSQLYDVDRDNAEILEQLRQEHLRQWRRIEALRPSDAFGSAAVYKELKRFILEYGRFTATWILAQRLTTLTHAIMLRVCTRAQIAGLETKVHDFHAALETDTICQKVLETFQAKARRFLTDSFWTPTATVKRRLGTARAAQRRTESVLRESLEDIWRLAERNRRLAAAASTRPAGPLDLVVRMDDHGRVVGVLRAA